MPFGLMTRILFISIVCCVILTAQPADAADEANETVESLSAAIDGAQSPDQLARYHKRLGDLYASRDDFENAAKSYLLALSSYSGFSLEERFSMAVTISWAPMHDESIGLLNSILAEKPKYTDARVHLSRVLSWSGQLDASIKEADRALESNPANREALLVKANAIRWKGDSRAAIEVYETLLEQSEEFAPRLGLGYALLAVGDTKGAKGVAAGLTPASPKQKDDKAKLAKAIKKAEERRLNAGFKYIDDSDENRVYRYTIKYDFSHGMWLLGLDYSHVVARDPIRKKNSNSLYLRAYSKLTSTMGAGGGVGLSRPANSLTAHVKADRDMFGGRAGVVLAKGAMTDTAELIENRIRTTSLNLHLSRPLAERVVGIGSVEFRDYSDDNSALDLNLTARYLYMLKPRVYLGYRLRYMDFERHSGGGYFDPKEFISHQLFAKFTQERDLFRLELDGYVGPQSFDRFGEHTSDLFSGATVTVGREITGGATVEFSFDTGRSAQGPSGGGTGYSYYLMGLNLIYVPG